MPNCNRKIILKRTSYRYLGYGLQLPQEGDHVGESLVSMLMISPCPYRAQHFCVAEVLLISQAKPDFVLCRLASFIDM
jgi:hypothetical protein